MLDGELYAQTSHLGGLLGDGCCQLARFDSGHGVVNGIEADEDDLVCPSSRFRRLDSAQDHLVVVSEDAIDLWLGLEDVLEDAQALGAVEVGRLTSDDLDARALAAHVVVEALSSVAGRRCSGDAL